MAILVVEDDELCAQLIEETLEGENFDVLLARDGAEGLAMLEQRQHEIELILLDRMMPRVDGMAFIRNATQKGLTRSIPIVMQTAAGTQQQVIEGASTGVYYYLTKPYEHKHLLAVVRSALSDREQVLRPAV